MPKTKSQRYHERYHREHPEVNWKSKLMKNYGITPEDYQRMLDAQGGRCAICRKHQSELDYPLGVDHDHASGKVRGLTCASCNHILGRCGDDVSILLAAVDYLRRGGYAYPIDGSETGGVPGRVVGNGGTDGTPSRAGGSSSDDDRTSEVSVSVDPDAE